MQHNTADQDADAPLPILIHLILGSTRDGHKTQHTYMHGLDLEFRPTFPTTSSQKSVIGNHLQRDQGNRKNVLSHSEQYEKHGHEQY